MDCRDVTMPSPGGKVPPVWTVTLSWVGSAPMQVTYVRTDPDAGAEMTPAVTREYRPAPAQAWVVGEDMLKPGLSLSPSTHVFISLWTKTWQQHPTCHSAGLG